MSGTNRNALGAFIMRLTAEEADRKTSRRGSVSGVPGVLDAKQTRQQPASPQVRPEGWRPDSLRQLVQALSEGWESPEMRAEREANKRAENTMPGASVIHPSKNSARIDPAFARNAVRPVGWKAGSISELAQAFREGWESPEMVHERKQLGAASKKSLGQASSITERERRTNRSGEIGIEPVNLEWDSREDGSAPLTSGYGDAHEYRSDTVESTYQPFRPEDHKLIDFYNDWMKERGLTGVKKAGTKLKRWSPFHSDKWSCDALTDRFVADFPEDEFPGYRLRSAYTGRYPNADDKLYEGVWDQVQGNQVNVFAVVEDSRTGEVLFALDPYHDRVVSKDQLATVKWRYAP